MTCDAAVRSSQHPGNCSHSSPDGACSSFDFHTNIAYVLDGDMFSATIPTAFQVTRKFLEGSGEEGLRERERERECVCVCVCVCICVCVSLQASPSHPHTCTYKHTRTHPRTITEEAHEVEHAKRRRAPQR